MDAPVLTDGLLRFQIRDTGSGEVKDYAIDALALKMTCDECIDLHKLPVDEAGNYKPNLSFLLDLAGRLAMFVPDCTTAVAMQLWRAAFEGIEGLKKNMSETPSSPTGTESTPSDLPPIDGSGS